MSTYAWSVMIVGLAVGAVLLAAPLDLLSLAALTLLALLVLWTRQRALERTAQSVASRLDRELGDLIEEAKRLSSSPKE